MAQGRGGRSTGGRGSKQQGGRGSGSKNGGTPASTARQFAAIPPPPNLYGLSPTGRSGASNAAGAAGGRGGRNQGLGAPRGRGRGEGRGRGGGRGQLGGRTGGHHPGLGLMGLANEFVHVEHDMRDGGVWKVSVPHGQRFGKQFLAGLEVWARQMVEHGRVDLLSGLPTLPLPALPTLPASCASAPAALHLSPDVTAATSTPQPAPPVAYSSAPAPAMPAAPGSASASSAFDFTSFLRPLASAASAPPAPPAAPTSAPSSGSGAFYRPAVEEHVQTEGKDSGGAAAARTEEPVLYAADIAGDGAPGDHVDEAGGGYSDEEDDEEGDEEGEEEYGDEGDEGQEGSEEGTEDSMEEPQAAEALTSAPGKGKYDFTPTAFSFSFSLGVQRSSGAPASPLTAVTPPPPPPPRALVNASRVSASSGPSPLQGGARNGSMAAKGRSSGNGAASGRVRVSLQLERQGMTDVEVELLARWYQERVSDVLELSKLWLFENYIGDAGAAAAASLFHASLLEVHLSHNQMTNKGLRSLLAAVPPQRTSGVRPLWLRVEWNMLELGELDAMIAQAAARGVRVHVPQVSTDASGTHGHEMKLNRQAPQGTQVQLPWIQMQKQPPSESGVLRATRAAYRAAGPEPGELGAAAAPRPSVSLGATLTAPPPVPAPCVLPPPPAPPQQPSRPAPSVSPVIAVGASLSCEYSQGPLLLFPDTSAVLSMLGANTEAGKPPLTLDLLQQLASAGRFGRSLPASDQTFIVISDSVMKQLDGLKAVPDCRIHIRKFLKEGLESMGPAGFDFLTVLGAHEGEGQLLAGGLLGAAGSNSPFLSSKGQKVDVKIVEVALYFMKEVLAGAGQQYAAAAGAAEDALGAAATEGSVGAGSAPPQLRALPHLPVMLLSNDNAQILAARAHGLPAFRLSSPGAMADQLQALVASSSPLTSGALRSMLAPQATLGLGAAAGISLQQHFDQVVANTRWMAQGLSAAAGLVEQVALLARSPDLDPATVVERIRVLLQPRPSVPSPKEQAAGEALPAGQRSAATPFAEIVGVVEDQLAVWEGLVKSHQAPSRVLQWAVQQTVERASTESDAV